MQVTIKDVAQLAGVSPITVSRVINNVSNVRPETRGRVVEAIRKLNYYPNRSARSLAARRSQCIAVAISQSAAFLFENPFYSTVLKGIVAVAERRGYRIVLSTLMGDDDCMTLYRERVIDGAILLAVGRSEHNALALHHERVPFVALNRFFTEFDISYVDVDNHGGAKMAIQHLLERGYKRIGFINGSHDLSNCQERYAGYRETLTAAGTFNEQLVIETEFSEAAGYKAASILLEQSVDAIFTAADITAVGAILAVRDSGLQVPKDVAVVGFDGIPIARYIVPPLTTVEQPAYQKGARAAEALLDILEGRVKPPVQVVLPTQLVVRRST